LSTNQIQQIPPQNPQQLTLDQLIQMINNSRDDILRTQSTASTAAIGAYDGLTLQLKSCIDQIQINNKEIIRLQELCIKNKIDITPPAVKLPANEGVVPPKGEPIVVTPPVKNK